MIIMAKDTQDMHRDSDRDRDTESITKLSAKTSSLIFVGRMEIELNPNARPKLSIQLNPLKDTARHRKDS